MQLRGHGELVTHESRCTLVSLGLDLAMLIVLQLTVQVTGTVHGRGEKGKRPQSASKRRGTEPAHGDETTFAVVLRLRRSRPTD